MSSHKKKQQSSENSLYPEVILTNPEANSPFSSNPVKPNSSSSLYPSVNMNNLAENLFPDADDAGSKTLNSQPSEEILIKVPGALIHLIDKEQSVELASGELIIVLLRQGENVIAVLARVGDEIQWPLAKDEAVVKLDESHYFFTLRVPDDDHERSSDGKDSESLLNYGLTIASKGQDNLLKELDGVLKHYSSFSVQEVKEVVDGSATARETSPDELGSEKNKELIRKSSTAYWTTLAPNVEDYSGSFARMIAAGTGHVIWGILWCGDVTVDRLHWGNKFLKKRIGSGSSEISPEALKRMKRVKKMTKMCDKMASGVLSGVVKVSGFFTSSVVNTKAGKKFFSLLPGEIVLASLDGFNKVCDAVEVAGRNVLSTTSVVTTGIVSQRYGEQAGKVTNDGLDAAGYALGTAWAVFKIRKAINPKSVFKPRTIAKVAVESSSSESKSGKKK